MTRLDRVLKLLEEYDDLASVAMNNYCVGQNCRKMLTYLRKEKEKLAQEEPMARLDQARNTLEQLASLTTILDKFYWDGDLAHVMYFTEEESAILAEYLMNNGIIVPVKEKTNAENL